MLLSLLLSHMVRNGESNVIGRPSGFSCPSGGYDRSTERLNVAYVVSAGNCLMVHRADARSPVPQAMKRTGTSHRRVIQAEEVVGEPDATRQDHTGGSQKSRPVSISPQQPQ